MNDIIEEHNDSCGMFLTTRLFRDCECERGYVLPVSVAHCLECGATMEDQPDSRVEEVLSEYRLASGPEICELRAAYAEYVNRHLKEASHGT